VTRLIGPIEAGLRADVERCENPQNGLTQTALTLAARLDRINAHVDSMELAPTKMLIEGRAYALALKQLIADMHIPARTAARTENRLDELRARRAARTTATR
jgi:hypothetical protein